jgi:hypothetical protein
LSPSGRERLRQQLTHWQNETDLASVRDPETLSKLPDDERAAWRRLWEGVAALRQKVEEEK